MTGAPALLAKYRAGKCTHAELATIAGYSDGDPAERLRKALASAGVDTLAKAAPTEAEQRRAPARLAAALRQARTLGDIRAASAKLSAQVEALRKTVEAVAADQARQPIIFVKPADAARH